MDGLIKCDKNCIKMVDSQDLVWVFADYWSDFKEM